MATKRKIVRRARMPPLLAGAPAESSAPTKQAILVLGMHRSGTSALTRVLNLLGADLPKNLMGPGIGNDTGHWESNDLVVIHDEMLASAGTSWHDWRAINPDWIDSAAAEATKQRLLAVVRHDYDDSSLFTIKDPRICRFVPIWLDVLKCFGAAPVPVLAIRSPLEVAASLRRRDGFPLTTSYLLWLRHVLDAERTSRGLTRAIVTYDRLMDDWRALIASIGERTGLRWPRRTDASELAVDRFLADTHRHHVTDEAQLQARADVADWVKITYGTLLAMSRVPEQDQHYRSLDRISAEFDKAATAFGLLLAGETENAQNRIHDADERVNAAVRERDRASHALAEREVKLAQSDAALIQARQIVSEQAARIRELDEKLVVERGRTHEAETGRAAGVHESERWRHELDATRTLLRESQTQAQRLAGEFAQAQQQLSTALQQIDTLNTECSVARASASAYEANLAAARRLTHEEKDNAQKHKDECDLLRRELDTTQNVIRNTRQEIAATRNSLRDARREKELAFVALQETQREMQDTRYKRSRLESELAIARDVAIKTQAELNSVQEARNSLQISMDESIRAKDEAARLREIVQQTQAQAQRDATTRQEETIRLHREIASLRTEAEFHRLKEQAEQRQHHDAAFAHRGIWPFSRLRPRSLTVHQRQDIEMIQKSGLFDPLWYLKRYPDVAAAGQDPLVHYVLHGGSEQRDPHPLFDGKWYSAQYPDHAAMGLSPLGHYVVEGVAKNYDPNPLFDTDWYLQQYPDVAASKLNPLHHFWTIGALHGHDPNPMFDTSWYLDKNPDVKRAGENALQHYRTHGWREARDPHPLFSYRLNAGPRRDLSTDPLEDYLRNRNAPN